MKCEICGQSFNKCNGLVRHIHSAHNITDKEYYDKYLKQPNEGTCLTCGKSTKFTYLKNGYETYCSLECNPNSDIQICKICNEKCFNLKTLSSHIKKHNINKKQYYDIYMKKDGEGFCPVCNKPTKWTNSLYGYAKHCSIKCASLDPNVQEKLKTTNIQKYGVEHTSKLKENRDKAKQTNVIKYGVESYGKTKEYRQQQSQRMAIKYKEVREKKQQKIDYLIKNFDERLDICYIDNIKYTKCKICNTIISCSGLGIHITKHHKISLQNYYDTYKKQNEEDICKYCGLKTPFINTNIGYAKFCNEECKANYYNKATISCAICGSICIEITFRNHLNAIHNISKQQYYDLFLKEENEEYCKYCHKPTTFISFDKGYKKYCSIECEAQDTKSKILYCKICNESFIDKHQLSMHIRKHNISLKDYYDSYIKINEQEGYCLTCNNPTKFISIFDGYVKHCCDSCAILDPKVQNKIKTTCLQKYGVINALLREDIRIKALSPEARAKAISKARKTNLERYGVTCTFQSNEVINKTKQTSLERYGVDWPTKAIEVQNKIKETSLERYGAENIFSSEYGKNKIRAIMQERYGVPYYSQTNEYIEKVTSTNREKYGVNYNLQRKETLEQSKITKSKKYENNNYSYDKFNNTLEQNNKLDKELGDPDE